MYAVAMMILENRIWYSAALAVLMYVQGRLSLILGIMKCPSRPRFEQAASPPPSQTTRLV